MIKKAAIAAFAIINFADSIHSVSDLRFNIYIFTYAQSVITS